MFIPFRCLCPLRLAIMLNFYLMKVAYDTTLNEYKKKASGASDRPFKKIP